MMATLDSRPLDTASAASLLGWWLEAGVDLGIAETPRNWLKPETQPASPVAAHVLADPQPALETLDAFHAWLADAKGLPLDRPGARRVMPTGAEGAPVMLLADLPGPDEAAAGRAIAGDSWLLATRMMQAIGIDANAAYVAALSCFHAPGARLSREDAVKCGELAREQVRLAKPQRLILFGDAPARALLGHSLADARGKLHRVEGVRTVATFHPRWLLQRPSDKALAWRDLLIMMSEDE